MDTDILIVREGEGYRVLFGYLHLTAGLIESDEVRVHVQGEGEATVVRTAKGLLVSRGNHHLPLLRI